MKKIIIFSLFVAFVFSYQLSLAESYPTTCPTEAQGILKAVGGCSTIDCKTYSNICAKCCVVVAAPVKTVLPTPAKTATQQSGIELPLVSTSTESSTQSTDTDLSSEVIETIIPSTEENVEPDSVLPEKKEPQNILIKFFNWLFRRNK